MTLSIKMGWQNQWRLNEDCRVSVSLYVSGVLGHLDCVLRHAAPPPPRVLVNKPHNGSLLHDQDQKRETTGCKIGSHQTLNYFTGHSCQVVRLQNKLTCALKPAATRLKMTKTNTDRWEIAQLFNTGVLSIFFRVKYVEPLFYSGMVHISISQRLRLGSFKMHNYLKTIYNLNILFAGMLLSSMFLEVYIRL